MERKITPELIIDTLKREIDDVDLSNVEANTNIRELPGWNSLHGLITMALAATEFGYDLSAEEIQSIYTVNDIYKILSNAGNK